MSRKNFQKALREAEERQVRERPVISESMTDEEVRETAFQSRRNREANIPQKLADDNTRNNLLRQTGYDYIDIEELQPHPENKYHFDERDIENLAGLIYSSKETQPLVVRETENGLQIIDGERRWHAHKLLAKLYGDLWRMVPARVHPLGSLSDQEVMFILHSNNAGQRIQTASERAMGFAFIADTIMEWRKSNPELRGVATKSKLAEHFGVSERTAQKNLTIARGLIPRCCELLDNKKMTLEQAESIARLSEEVQSSIATKLENEGLTIEEVSDLVQRAKNGEDIEQGAEQGSVKARKKKDATAYLKTARNALRKAARKPEAINYKLLGEVKQLIKDIEEIQAELERRSKI